MKTGDLVIYKGLVNPDLNIQLEADEYRHTMNVWDEEFKLAFWWEPLPAILDGHVYKFGYTLLNTQKNRIECGSTAGRNLTIEELHCATVGIIRDVFKG
ncbi:TPA: hypothetical protein ACGR60_004428 [Escherichia coli]